MNPLVTAVLLTLKLASITTVLLLLIGIPLAWWLSRLTSSWKPLIETVVALPLILPPTVLGFYLLLAFAPQNGPGQLWQQLTGNQLAFSFSALVIGSVIYSLPFVEQPLQQAFERIPVKLLEAATIMGASPADRFLSVVLPLSRSSIMTAASMGFAHTIGEFGVVLMIGGNIPGETRVISIALYDLVESQQYLQAHWLAGGLLITSLLLLTLIQLAHRVSSRQEIIRAWH